MENHELFRSKSREQLEKQTSGVSKTINAPIIPSFMSGDIFNAPQSVLKDKFPNQYKIYVNILRREKCAERTEQFNANGNFLTERLVITRIREGKSIRWGQIPKTDINILLNIVAETVRKPVSMLIFSDLREPIGLLHGRNLTKLYQYARRQERSEQDPMGFILEWASIKPEKKDVVQLVSSGQDVQWKRIPQEVAKSLLVELAQEIGKPASMLTAQDLHCPAHFLNGHNLGGFFRSAQRNPARAEKDTMAYILEKACILPTVEDALVQLRKGGQIFWDRLGWGIIGEIVKKAASEIGVSASMIQTSDLLHAFKFLNGHKLQGLWKYLQKHPNRKEKGMVAFLLENIGVSIKAEDVITHIIENRHVDWNRIPPHELIELLKLAAKEAELPAIALEGIDLLQPFNFLNGHSLNGLKHYIYRIPPSKNKDHIAQFFENIGFNATIEDFMDWIKADRIIFWGRMSWNTIEELLVKTAGEAKIQQYTLTIRKLKSHWDSLNGRTLSGFYDFCFRHPERQADETTMDFIRRKLNLPSPSSMTPSNERSAFRFKQMQGQLGSFLQSLDYVESISVEKLIPLIEKISKIYRSSYFGIDEAELTSEAVVLILEARQSTLMINDLPKILENIHQGLERFSRDAINKFYKERTLSTPVTENLTLQGILKSPEIVPTIDAVDISAKLREKMNKLSPIQRRLIWRVAVDEMTFEDLEGEFGLDSEILQEHYDDALVLLQGKELES